MAQDVTGHVRESTAEVLLNEQVVRFPSKCIHLYSQTHTVLSPRNAFLGGEQQPEQRIITSGENKSPTCSIRIIHSKTWELGRRHGGKLTQKKKCYEYVIFFQILHGCCHHEHTAAVTVSCERRKNKRHERVRGLGWGQEKTCMRKSSWQYTVCK